MSAPRPSADRPLVVIGFLGVTLDAGTSPERWERWRPTVALCQQEDLVIRRLELLHPRGATRLFQRIRDDVASVSPETEVRSQAIELRDPWDFEEVYGALYDFARRYPFDTEREEYLIHLTTGTHVAQICMFLLTESRRFPARLVQTAPPATRRTGLPGALTVVDLDLSRYDRLASRFRDEQAEARTFLKSGIPTRNVRFNRLIERIEQVALSSRLPILLTGPTGAGKSLIARRIHELRKARRLVSGPFVEVNSATLRGDAAMSALFGHVKGAFTGAGQDRAGLLRRADGGILFLDEVGELGPDEQAMLLRALEEKVFLPVGADAEVRSDFQLIAGTNRDLSEDVAAGRFREDLLARIHLWTFRLPSLRERMEDIEPNLDYELELYERTTGTRVSFNKEARARFLGFATAPDAAWRGNFRDLNAAVMRMATLTPGARITVDVVDEEVARLRESWRGGEGFRGGPRGGASGGDDGEVEELLGRERADALDRFDRVQLAEVLRTCRASRSLAEAGRALFGASRARRKRINDADRVRKYLARFGIGWDDLFGSRGV